MVIARALAASLLRAFRRGVAVVLDRKPTLPRIDHASAFLQREMERHRRTLRAERGEVWRGRQP